MTYEQTIEFLFSQLPAYHRIGKAAYKNDLNNSIAFDDYLKHPHKKYRTIHVAGTNGKGSVSHMIASILQEAGYTTGLYTSPHLKDFRERIKVDGEMIPENKVIEFVKKHKQIIDSLNPSFFEMTVAMAFDYFLESDVDVAVIEVGLGGRLDSTNIINPVLSVITNIGSDHMDLLGDTLEKIATEKAGIIKRGVPVVISETQSVIKEIFISKARESGSLICFADERYSCEFEESDCFELRRRYVITDLLTQQKFEEETLLGGDCQSRNLKAVFSVCSNLRNIFNITDKNIMDGLGNVVKNTSLKGRWQKLSLSPLTICDTGHNKEGLEIIMAQIRRIPKSGLHMIIGFVRDKDLSAILPLFPSEAIYYFTKANIPRALNEESLKFEAAKYGLIGQSYSDVKTAFYYAKKKAVASEMIFIGGSTFIVAEVI
ncbi:MAG TPA: folylpolyglutamate synthase/dihydrofolate synthase family protein [Bacteroidales bacterium]|nr:folylpolyglutamate synthase/dihydrofolate synthase family protein [Bacteroidales bacterium]